MRDSNGDSNAPSPTVVRQRPLTREHAQNRHCGHRCWLLLISGIGLLLATTFPLREGTAGVTSTRAVTSSLAPRSS
jgi:hypothetical protein